VANFLPPLRAWLLRRLSGDGTRGLWHLLALGFYRAAQWRTEMGHARNRNFLFRADFRSRQALSFTGEME